jgi:hypothetical protein
MPILDPDGQPNPAINIRRRESRDTSELLGIVRGILADGHVSDSEIVFLAEWLLTNQEFAARWPFNRLVERLAAALEDERIDEDERTELHEIMLAIVGNPSPDYFVTTPTTFPLTKPEPEVIFDSNEFVLTGKFVFGTRKQCETEVTLRGGTCCDRVTLRTNYLVIGAMSSRDWVTASWGRKIELAAQYAETHPLFIVTEQRWADSLLPS